MNFEWDKNKNSSNIKKHGVDFNDAKDVFLDKKHKIIPSNKKNCNEKRWAIIGKIIKTITVVIYTMRKTAIRIISARRASKKERNLYKNK